MKIKIKEVDAITGEETIYERDETPEEQSSREALIAEMDNEVAQLEAKAAVKESAYAKLAALGLTEDEAKAIVG